MYTGMQTGNKPLTRTDFPWPGRAHHGAADGFGPASPGQPLYENARGWYTRIPSRRRTLPECSRRPRSARGSHGHRRGLRPCRVRPTGASRCAPAVVVVDFSYGFTDPGYPTGADMTAAVLGAARLLETARAQGLPVVFTTIAYDPAQAVVVGVVAEGDGHGRARASAAAWWTSTTGSTGARTSTWWSRRVRRRSSEPRWRRTSPRCARIPSSSIGATTSGCVRATVVDAVQHGYPTLVPRDCVADRAQAPHDASLFDMNEKYADVVDLDDVLGYLRGLRPPLARPLVGPRGDERSHDPLRGGGASMTLTSQTTRERGRLRRLRPQAVPGQRFASPFAVQTPAGAEGWQSMYPVLRAAQRASAGSSRTASSGSSTGCTTPSRSTPSTRS